MMDSNSINSDENRHTSKLLHSPARFKFHAHAYAHLEARGHRAKLVAFQLTPTCFAMLLLLLGIEDLSHQIVGDQPHNKEGADLLGSAPSRRLVLLVIALILCHVGAVVS